MTGNLRSYAFSSHESPPEYTALEIRFADGDALACVNKRRLGQIAIVEDIDAYVREQELGPDALAATRDQLAAVIRDGRGAVKSTLMNQSRLAGLGNIYTDEVLFQSGIDPRRNCDETADSEIRAIHDQIHRVCEHAIRAHADPQAMPESFLIRHREPGADCPKCGGTVKKVTVSGRSAYLCESCQG
jgi:formamidopyrimidine-DNA glycosylase